MLWEMSAHICSGQGCKSLRKGSTGSPPGSGGGPPAHGPVGRMPGTVPKPCEGKAWALMTEQASLNRNELQGGVLCSHMHQ